MEKVFKKTIQFNIIVLIAMIISVFNETYEVNKIIETISSGIFDNDGFVGFLFGILFFVNLIAYFVSLYFVYSFKKFGRKLYTITLTLKQGWYDYTYWVDDPLDPFQMDRTFFNTENLYEVFVYFRPMGGRGDELVSYFKFNYNKLR